MKVNLTRRRLVLLLMFMLVLLAFFNPWYELHRIQGTSMWPMFLGGEIIVVLKNSGDITYQDLVVVRTESGENLLKRVVARGGDTVEIAHGDVYITRPYKERRVTPRTLAQSLKTAVSVRSLEGMRLVQKEVSAGEERNVVVEAGEASISDDLEHLQLRAPEDVGVLRFPQALLRTVRGAGRVSRLPVRDMSMELEITGGLEPTAELLLEQWGKKSDGTPVRLSGVRFERLARGISVTPLGGARNKSVAGPEQSRFRWTVFDDTITVEAWNPGAEGPAEVLYQGRRKAVSEGRDMYIKATITSGYVTFGHLDIVRDIHYTSGRSSREFETTKPYTVGDGGFWVLGDNSFESRDSRELGSFGAEDVVGRPTIVLWPPGRARFLSR